MVPAWGLTFQLPQRTVIIRVASQGVFTKCSRKLELSTGPMGHLGPYQGFILTTQRLRLNVLILPSKKANFLIIVTLKSYLTLEKM